MTAECEPGSAQLSDISYICRMTLEQIKLMRDRLVVLRRFL
jgi:hypothetical protein